MSLRRGMMAGGGGGGGGGGSSATALSIYNKVVAWWERDEASGTTMTDAHTNALHGTYSGLTVNQSGLAGNLNKSVTFPAGNNYAETADNALLDLTGDIAVMVWVKRNGAQSSFPKFMWKPINAGSGTMNYGLFQNNSTAGGKVVFRVQVNGGSAWDATSTTALADATTYCLVGQRASSMVEIWVNATREEQNNTGIGSAALQTSANALRFGYTAGTGDNWVGSQDQAAVFNNDLTSAEIAYLYNSGAGISYAALKADAGIP